VQLPEKRQNVGGEAEALIRISERILGYLARSNEPRTRSEIEAHVEGRTVHKRAALKELRANGRVVQSGRGTKGDPFGYRPAESG
jgi:hypothetical protein